MTQSAGQGTGPDQQEDIAALAKGGRTNFFGFLLRLVARIPFLFIASASTAQARWGASPRPLSWWNSPE